jgi:hypothetical protein
MVGVDGGHCIPIVFGVGFLLSRTEAADGGRSEQSRTYGNSLFQERV